MIKGDVDFVFDLGGGAIWCDAKCTQDPVWNIKHYIFAENHIHQWAKLSAVVKQSPNVDAGFLIWFYKTRDIVWCPVRAVEHALASGAASIYPLSPLCTSQPDETQIFFRRLILSEKDSSGTPTSSPTKASQGT